MSGPLDTVTACPTGSQVSIDALVTAKVPPLWRAVLGYQTVADEDVPRPASLRVVLHGKVREHD
jgi:hypothetical protein